jgi:hypothetical protein
MITVTDGNLADAHELAPKLGDMELLEISHCAPELTPLGALEACFKEGNKVRAVRDSKDGCISLFGVNEVEPKEGVAWMLNSKNFFTRGISHRFVRESKDYIKEQMEHFDLLYNFVSVRNTPSIKWLALLGFTIVYDEPIDITGEPFYFFYLRK